MKTLGITHSVCGTCRRIVPAKIVVEDDDVYFEKFCVEHGSSRTLVRRNVAEYLRTLRYVKPAWIPKTFAGDATASCPDGCGMCSRHEQHLCMPLVEITSRCNLTCPICLVDAGTPWDMRIDEFQSILDGLIAAEGQVDILNLSGGEPLLHPQLVELLDRSLSRSEIVRVSISTNGLALLDRPDLIDCLRKRNVVVSLQFDGFKDDAYVTLRGRPLLAEKRRILQMLAENNISTSLTMTLAGGVNDDQLPAVVEYLFKTPNVVSLTVQPLVLAGRALAHRETLGGDSVRLTMPDVIAMFDKVWIAPTSAADFSPLPCSHPLCFCQAFYLMLDGGGVVAVERLVDDDQRLDAVANRTVFGLDAEDQDRMKDMIYGIWTRASEVQNHSDAIELNESGLCPCMSEKIMKTMRSMLDEMASQKFDAQRMFSISERRIKSIFIHAFQDAETFDLARARRCCNAYPQPDGTLRPACVYNVLGRKNRRVEE
jgi:uncharacterized radical SAM superfamily Fe-S cluster-containing enzyme